LIHAAIAFSIKHLLISDYLPNSSFVGQKVLLETRYR